MFCENCGKKNEAVNIFCIHCGSNISSKKNLNENNPQINEDKVWYRIAKVLYISSYMILFAIVAIVWTENYSTYNYSEKYYTTNPKGALFGSLFVLFVGWLIIRIIKAVFLYIFLAQKPNFKNELKKIY